MSFHTPRGAEAERLEQDARREQNWKRWGPYLSERQWGTVREDYSADGNCWGYFPHDHARSRAYRWGEDGLLGITDRECRLCFGLALWNGHDPILKERLYGLTGPEGNHGEDVKECYYYLDATPTHSYLKALYKYPQTRFPYEQLLTESRRRDKRQPEFELADTGVFNDNRYFDIFAEYAKAGPNDMLIRVRVANRGPVAAALHVLPTIWFRNTWVWGCLHEGCWVKPAILINDEDGVTAEHVSLGRYRFAADKSRHARTWLFTDNETNQEKLFGVPNYKPWVKDSFHDYVVGGNRAVVNPKLIGTKVATHYKLELAPGEETAIDLRLFDEQERPTTYFGANFEQTLADRVAEADEYYDQLISPQQTEEERRVSRQGYAGLLWTKQFYHYIVEDWLKGDPDTPTPPPERKRGRNSDWPHLYNRDIISMPDKWEYPWYAAWDSAFHMLPFAKLDPHFAKDQLKLFLREWYMHPNGQMPAYEFNFSDVNPPVHAWACWRAYKLTGERGHRDVQFLSSVFQKLLINFTWWVNRKDRDGKHLFSGGFLGLDNIGVFDRSRPLPTGGHLEQADGTAWMAFYCATMLSMALELARFDPGAEDIASKFFEHFIHIADAMNCLGGTGLWNEEDGFYYDQLHADGQTIPLRVRSIVGLIPLFAVEVLQDDVIDRLPGFRKRLDWFLEYRSDLARHISYLDADGDVLEHGHHLLAIPSRERLVRVLGYMLDENEFLSPFGIRSLSKHHEKNPYVFRTCGEEFRVDYVPAESNTYMFGGNSNWRGPIWFPLNYLLIEALERYHHFYGDSLLVECPTGSGITMNLLQVAQELDRRLATLFLPDGNGKRPCHGDEGRYATDPHFRDLVLFHEYFHADNGRGVGASHQTGWTSLVVRCLEKQANQRTARE